jgi:hypothetical protein
MSLQVLVHLDLSPENKRPKFNDEMAAKGWHKVDEVFTAWTAIYTNAEDMADAVRGEAMDEIRRIAQSVDVKFTAVIMVGNTKPKIFESLQLVVAMQRTR